MEGGCYERCYDNVLNLHMLRDIEEWANSLIFNQTYCSDADIVNKSREVRIAKFCIRRKFSDSFVGFLNYRFCEDQDRLNNQITKISFKFQCYPTIEAPLFSV